MLKPNFIIHNYIDTKPLVEASKENLAEFKDKLQELNEILKEIEKKLPATSDLKILIKDLQENASQAQENPEAQHRILKTVSDLGDSNSSISKMLTGAGVAENLLKKVYGIATFLFKHWPF
jgi:methylthioribose-1-phosphate isomerase